MVREPEKRLGNLADEINAEHGKFRAAFKATYQHAIRVGALLGEAKAAVGHGGWSGWVAENCAFSMRTAQVYMRVAANREQIVEMLKSADSAHFSIEGALRQLAAPVSNIPARERLILDRAREMWEAGYLGHLAPVMERLEAIPDERRRGFVAETAWAALFCRVQDYGLARSPLEDGGAASLAPGELDDVVAAIHRAAEELRWWVEQTEWIEAQVRARDWAWAGPTVARAALDPERKHLPLPALYEDEDEDGLRSPRGFVRDLCGPVV